MDRIEWGNRFLTGFTEIAGQMMAYLPRVLAAIAILIAGWLIAKLIRIIGEHLIGGLDRLWHKMVVRSGLEPLRSGFPPARIVGEILFWLVILLFITLASQVLGLGAFVSWVTEVIAYLPLLIAGLLIVLAGFIVSSLIRDLVTAASISAGMVQGELLGRAAQVVILFTAIILGIDQIGIDVTFLAVMAGIILSATLGAVALAFGLGAHAGNIIAAHQLQDIYKPGDLVQIDEFTGRIIEISATRVILDAEQGRIHIPASRFDEAISILTTELGHEGD